MFPATLFEMLRLEKRTQNFALKDPRVLPHACKEGFLTCRDAAVLHTSSSPGTNGSSPAPRGGLQRGGRSTLPRLPELGAGESLWGYLGFSTPQPSELSLGTLVFPSCVNPDQPVGVCACLISGKANWRGCAEHAGVSLEFVGPTKSSRAQPLNPFSTNLKMHLRLMVEHFTAFILIIPHDRYFFSF